MDAGTQIFFSYAICLGQGRAESRESWHPQANLARFVHAS
ncbi:hypothetical protein L345_02207, partial [Ophiophagus hannah]